MPLARSLKQAVEQAQQHITEESRQTARFVDLLTAEDTTLHEFEESQRGYSR